MPVLEKRWLNNNKKWLLFLVTKQKACVLQKYAYAFENYLNSKLMKLKLFDLLISKREILF